MSRIALSHKFAELSTGGYYIALRIGFAFPIYEKNAFPNSWVDSYTAQGLMLHDPIMRWVYDNTGCVRWSAITLPDPREVMLQALAHGLRYGAVVCCTDEDDMTQRSFGSFARTDREFTDSELSELMMALKKMHDDTMPPRNLTEAELEVLRMMREGMLMKQIAEELGVSLGAVKQRLKNAKFKLDAKTSSQATARALEYGLI